MTGSEAWTAGAAGETSDGYRWLVLAMVFFLYGTAIGLVWQAIPPLKAVLAADTGTTASAVVLVFAAINFTLLLFQLKGGLLGDRFALRHVVGVVTAARGLFPSSPGLLVGVVVAGYFGGGMLAMIYLLPGHLRDIGPARAGTMSGVLLSLGILGGTLGPVVGATALESTGLVTSAVLVAVPLLLAVPCTFRPRLDSEPTVPAPEMTADAGGTDDRSVTPSDPRSPCRDPHVLPPDGRQFRYANRGRRRAEDRGRTPYPNHGRAQRLEGVAVQAERLRRPHRGRRLRRRTPHR
jgi:MFS family permease